MQNAHRTFIKINVSLLPNIIAPNSKTKKNKLSYPSYLQCIENVPCTVKSTPCIYDGESRHAKIIQKNIMRYVTIGVHHLDNAYIFMHSRTSHTRVNISETGRVRHVRVDGEMRSWAQK
ncbi:hypothetical protein BCR43DRAFT_10262 [Syncephalastrum racemosum]|uniref:Uncharacterized protein n=1 Tax=Syncephalastrum racemosum TaxID=13706 RepID=A0A1X2HSC6_SYNRA|nr:hypothetical protein BCR43DRAFT_10262 [Syncephalastrum racemosum]